jgi:phosphatidylinositol kinase/protein kinase (PI-3  family)
VSGKIIHIDFGDCFEVTRTREKYPERVPFRLTRMLINAMEVCGIEGFNPKYFFIFFIFYIFNFYFFIFFIFFIF